MTSTGRQGPAAGRRLCICVGAGGVGKTPSAAAIALHRATQGQRVALVTIDPARRRAGALGMQELGNEPRRVEPHRLQKAGLDVEGELWAMMLDPKRTFDELIGRLAPDARTRDEILANRIYRELSSAVAGSQEFTAIAKLYELDRDESYDSIVLDTPPSGNALDFINAPARLTQFFEARALKALRAPTGLATRIAGKGTDAALAVLKRVTGVDLLRDIRTFFRALSGLVDGFGERAAGVAALLRDPATGVVLVSSAERVPVDEAIAFSTELRAAGIPIAAVIVNRLTERTARAADTVWLTEQLGERLAGRVVENLRDQDLLAARDAGGVARQHEALPVTPFATVRELDGDVHDLAGLAQVARALFQGNSPPGERPGDG